MTSRGSRDATGECSLAVIRWGPRVLSGFIWFNKMLVSAGGESCWLIINDWYMIDSCAVQFLMYVCTVFIKVVHLLCICIV